MYTFLLNAKGRISFDLFVYKETDNDALLIETESKWINALESTLKLYRLRRPIEIERSEFQVYFSDVRPENESSAFPDPRVPNFGYRLLRKPEYSVKFNQNNGPAIDYLARRLIWGIPEGEELHQQLPLNMNGDIMNAISFTKGSINLIKNIIFKICLKSWQLKIFPTPCGFNIDGCGVEFGIIGG